MSTSLMALGSLTEKKNIDENQAHEHFPGGFGLPDKEEEAF